MKRNLPAFTLVELIVVITILAILATIGFVSFSGYLAGARDTNRIAQLKSMSDALELYRTKKDLPIPDDKVDVQASGTTIAYQGYIGANVLETIEYTEKGLDPKDKTYFSYYLTKDKKYFQLLSFLEEPSTDVLANTLLKTTQAVDYSSRVPHVKGKKLGILTDENNTPIQELTTITVSGYLDLQDVGTTVYKSIISDEEITSGSGTTLSSMNPNGSCKRIKQINGGSADGTYTIDPAGDSVGFEVYCDMTTNGGGWTYTTMLADITTKNLFDTGNTNKVTSLTENISSKGTISNIWLDNENKDIMLICKTTATDDVRKKFESPFFVYQFQKSDIGNLEKASKAGTQFSSQSLTAEWRNYTYSLLSNYSGGSNANSFYLTTSGGRVYTFEDSYRLYISSASTFNDSPAYNPSGTIDLYFDTQNYCMSAIR